MLRTGEGIGGGLSRFSFDENGTVPLRSVAGPAGSPGRGSPAGRTPSLGFSRRLDRRIVVAAFVAALFLWEVTAGASKARGEVLGRILQRAPQPAPSTSTAYAPVPGKPPYFGKALGATYYAWGYFGARENCQRSFRVPYYNEYPQWGHRNGY
jgi:hypothetical protein